MARTHSETEGQRSQVPAHPPGSGSAGDMREECREQAGSEVGEGGEEGRGQGIRTERRKTKDGRIKDYEFRAGRGGSGVSGGERQKEKEERNKGSE